MKSFALAVFVFLVAPGLAHAAGGVVESRTGVAPDRYVYYPGTEALAQDEIRLTACGTGSMRSGPQDGGWSGECGSS
jgi:ribonuclease Z